jgi:hypothetical protein
VLRKRTFATIADRIEAPNFYTHFYPTSKGSDPKTVKFQSRYVGSNSTSLYFINNFSSLFESRKSKKGKTKTNLYLDIP